MAQKIAFIVFGGTGDLMKRKLAPAFAKVIASGTISKDSVLIGISRKKFNHEAYRSWLGESLKEQEKKDLNNANIFYISGDASHPEGLNVLARLLNNYKEHQKIFYLSVSFTLFSDILSTLQRHQLAQGAKIVFEKPFGHDLASSDALDVEIHRYFSEKEVYRIDHYLAKETVLNLTTLKFTNPILEAVLNNQFVESIEVIADEDLGVGNRLEYYNSAGAIKDMIQSHLLQVLALLLIDKPSTLSAENIHAEKVKILKNLSLTDSHEHLLGQYISYKEELSQTGLSVSQTETFAKLILNCNTPRWDGVKLIIRTGKKLLKKYGQMKITFKNTGKDASNELIIDIFPKQDIVLTLNSRVSESSIIKPVRFEFCHDCEFSPNTPDEYAVLLQEIVAGNALLFPRYEEIREAWRIVDEIEKKKHAMKFVVYKNGTHPTINSIV